MHRKYRLNFIGLQKNLMTQYLLAATSAWLGVLHERYSAKPAQRSSHTGPPGYIGWTMDTVPAYVDWTACTQTPLSGLS